ncbi:hypothetical protein KHP62_11050 [Rhodobacteraceae bacterium NNCM2]|nr:hypothetical protein [Coraliihabitans acroporae]
MTNFKNFMQNEAGAVTIDWVALTAGILLLAIALVYGIFNNGVTPLVSRINDSLGSAGVGVDTGDAPSLNP